MGAECVEPVIDEDLSKAVPGTLQIHCVQRVFMETGYLLKFYKRSNVGNALPPFHETKYETDNSSEPDENVDSTLSTGESTSQSRPIFSIKVGQWYATAENITTGS